MSTKRQIEAYRKRLAKIGMPKQLTSECLNAVVAVSGRYDDLAEVEQAGTLVAVEHHVGAGMFGPAVYTRVKLCPACVDKTSGACKPVNDLPWINVTWLTKSPRRNGDGETDV